MKTTKLLDEVQEKFGPIKNINSVHKNKLSPIEKLAVAITERVGTMSFFFVILVWTILWLGWNMLAPKNLRFDPFPGFVLWLFISNLIQIHLMPLIMVGQNIQGKHQELRSQHDYDTDKRAEAEVKVLITQLENQEKMLEEIINRISMLEKKVK